MINIYSKITEWFFLKTKQPNFTNNVINFKDQLINSAIQMYQEVSSSFKATPAFRYRERERKNNKRRRRSD